MCDYVGVLPKWYSLHEFMKLQFTYNCVVDKGAAERKLGRIFLFFFSPPLSLQDFGSYFLWWSASIPVQAPSITYTHQHTTQSVWNKDRFYVQGPSVPHGIFNGKRLPQFVSISDVSLRRGVHSLSLLLSNCSCPALFPRLFY